MHQLQAFKHCYQHLIEFATAVGGSACALDGLLCQLILKRHTQQNKIICFQCALQTGWDCDQCCIQILRL